jgi:23S rRNA (cytosine1962-C5)-methyltransferase
MPEIVIKPGREKSILRHHPWIFSRAISELRGKPELGGTVEVLSSRGDFLARASYNPHTNIIGRIWTWDQNELVESSLFERRLQLAINNRRKYASLIPSNAMRLVHGESDSIPGLILDQYGEGIVVQFLAAGVEYWRDTIIEILRSITAAKWLYERSDVDVRQLEGLPSNVGIVYGEQHFANPIKILENDLKFWVDIKEGHKTGYYLDQRDNRFLAREIAAGRKILDCFSYTGGFTLNCLAGNTKSVTLVESSNPALEYARNNLKLNNFNLDNVTFVDKDVFRYLRELRDRDEHFNMIILDPPKFAPTVSQAERAARGYKDINMLALKILDVGGYLLTFSCSGGVSEDLFQKILAGAALDAGVNTLILKRLHQACDHPVALNFPEGAYLKGFLLQKIA